MRIESLEERHREMELTLYGNSREKVNGSGLVGESRTLRNEFEAFRDSMKRPPGWVALVIVGGVVSLGLSLTTLIALWELLIR